MKMVWLRVKLSNTKVTYLLTLNIKVGFLTNAYFVAF